jgi:hypothetical protein
MPMGYSQQTALRRKKCDMTTLPTVWPQFDKHDSLETDTQTMEELLETVFSMQSLPKLYEKYSSKT